MNVEIGHKIKVFRKEKIYERINTKEKKSYKNAVRLKVSISCRLLCNSWFIFIYLIMSFCDFDCIKYH